MDDSICHLGTVVGMAVVGKTLGIILEASKMEMDE